MLQHTCYMHMHMCMHMYAFLAACPACVSRVQGFVLRAFSLIDLEVGASEEASLAVYVCGAMPLPTPVARRGILLAWNMKRTSPVAASGWKMRRGKMDA